MSDAAKLNRWSFGTWETEIAPDGLVRGTSIFDGANILVRIDADPSKLAIDYHLGQAPDALVPRIHVRIVPGSRLGLEVPSAVLTFLAWRAAAMTDDRWHRLKVSHDFEVVLIKNLLENHRA
jgi:hypothetical protein